MTSSTSYFVREAGAVRPINLGQRENPLIHGAAEFDPAVVRGGRKSADDVRRELGIIVYGLERLMSKARPLIHRQPDLRAEWQSPPPCS